MGRLYPPTTVAPSAAPHRDWLCCLAVRSPLLVRLLDYSIRRGMGGASGVEKSDKSCPHSAVRFLFATDQVRHSGCLPCQWLRAKGNLASLTVIQEDHEGWELGPVTVRSGRPLVHIGKEPVIDVGLGLASTV
jgi:hypothetical protein